MNTAPITVLRNTAARLRRAGWTYDAAALDLVVGALERPALRVEARARRLFPLEGSDWTRDLIEKEAAE